MSEPALSDLARAIKKDDARQVVAAASKLLAGNKHPDPDVLEAKIVGLLHESKWPEVLTLTHEHPFEGRFAFHRAYALYRSDKFDAARECLEAAPKDVKEGEGALHLQAQILYRSGLYTQSAECYDRLLSMLLEEAGGDESAVDPAALDDLRLNLAASYVAAGRSEALLKHPQFQKLFDYLIAAGGGVIGAGVAGGKGGKLPSALSSAVFELLYNAACALIDAGCPSAAMRALVHAYQRGKDDLTADGAEASEIEDDLAIVRAQAAYLLQASHHYEASAAIYADLLKARPTDSSIPAVIAINNSLLATFSGSGKELVEAVRKLKATVSNASTTAKLLQRHLLALHHNSAVVNALLGQGAEAEASSGKASLALEALQKHAGGRDPHALAMAASLQLLKDGVMPALSTSTAANAAGSGASGAKTPVHQALASYLASASSSSSGLGGGGAGGGVHPAVAMRAQALASSGKLQEAAELLASAAGSSASSSSAGKIHPAVAASCAHLFLAKGDVERADKLLASAADAWTKASSSAGSPSGGGVVSTINSRDNAAVLTHARGALLLHANRLEEAAALFEGLARSNAVSNEQKASALACLSVVRTKQAAVLAATTTTATATSTTASTEEVEAQRSKLLASADICLREATAMVVGAGGKKPSFADLSSVNDREVDALEDIAAEPLSNNIKAAATGAGASATSATASSGVESEVALAKKAARAAAKKKKRMASRAKRREAYIAALKLRSPEFLALGVLPKPDPERWLPKAMRTYGKKSRKRQIAKAAANVSSAGGAQGAARDAFNEAAMRELDAKAKADAAKASSSASTSSPSVSGSAKKGGKVKGGRR